MSLCVCMVTLAQQGEVLVCRVFAIVRQKGAVAR